MLDSNAIAALAQWPLCRILGDLCPDDSSAPDAVDLVVAEGEY
ncbi:MAG: hypothetical protein NTX56_18845 [Proteobacteria bacterium]|nr:hypothetical protein [Pseudomonadota bacterium]